MEKEQIAQRLILEIDAKTQEQLHDLQWDMETQRRDILATIRNKAEEEAAIFKEQELHELRSNLIQNESQAKWKVKHDLLKRRSELVDALFEDVQNDLTTFVGGLEYEGYNRDKLKKLSERGDLGKATLIVMARDVELFKKILRDLALDYEVSVSDLIHIGGFLLVSENKRLEIDDTFDNRLQSQREWFFNHSKLVL